MNFLERIKYLGDFSFEKQLLIAVISSERAYREVYKIYPKGIDKRPIFKGAIDELWKYIKNNQLVNSNDLEEVDSEILIYVKDEFDLEPGEWAILFHPIITSLARCINLTIGMIRFGLGEKSGRTSANVVEKTRHIFGTIYETPNEERAISIKEKDWLTKAIYLVADHEVIPTNYEWFLERIPDYERGTIYKKFKDIE